MRIDGRGADEQRPISIQADFVRTAAGSCLIATGNTRVICTASVEEGVPPFLRDSGKVRKVLQGHYHPGHCSVHQGIEYRTFPALCEQDAAWEILIT